MGIVGYYRDSAERDEPIVEAYVELSRLRAWGWVKFLIDTGADRTTLYPGEDNSVHINYSALRSETLRTSMGVGGTDRYYREPARLVFFEDAVGTVSCFLDIDIWSPDPKRFEQLIPPLLGRDFLNLCDVRLNYSQNLVSLDPLNIESGSILSP